MRDRNALPVVLLVALFAAGATVQYAQETKPEQNTGRFRLNLKDGTSLLCLPKEESIPIITSYARIDAPYSKLKNLDLIQTNKATVVFLNGDKLQGECGIASLTVTSLIGQITVKIEDIRSLASAVEQAPAVIEDSPAKKNACINNLRQIDAAKEQYALANRLNQGAVVTGEQIGPYIKGGWQAMKCNAGGKYKINPIGANPECSTPGHKLPTGDFGQ
jgi:hypothetical protein